MSARFSQFHPSGFKQLQYSDCDWKFNNSLQCSLADGNCSKSEAVVAESERLCKETQEKTDKLKTQVERKFDQRIADVDHWRKESNKCISKLQEALDKLTHLKLRLREAIENCKEPISACRKALTERDKRIGVDMVQDKPQLEIQRYHVYLQEVVEVLENTIQEIEDQMINDRAAKQKLLRDVTDKQAALEIDTHASSCRPLNAVSKGFKFDPHLLSPDQKALSMAEWERTTRHNIEKAEQEVKNSRNISAKVEEILEGTYMELIKRRLNVLDALNSKIRESTETQKKLEERLARINKQILDVDDTLRKLDQSMERELPSLELASKRMEDRRRRPRHELCRDEVDTELEEEVRHLSLCMHQLREQNKQAKEMLRKLEQTKFSLEREVEVKKKSIYIDNEYGVNAFTNATHIRH